MASTDPQTGLAHLWYNCDTSSEFLWLLGGFEAVLADFPILLNEPLLTFLTSQKPQSWVSPEIPDTSAPPQVPSEHITVRSRKPILPLAYVPT